MARKKSKGQLNISFPKFKDERIYKLLGLFCIFISLYLFIAFTSYLITWQTDQSLVLEHSWGFLYEGEIGAANWLGRLGAIVSNMFFYCLVSPFSIDRSVLQFQNPTNCDFWDGRIVGSLHSRRLCVLLLCIWMIRK